MEKSWKDIGTLFGLITREATRGLEQLDLYYYQIQTLLKELKLILLNTGYLEIMLDLV